MSRKYTYYRVKDVDPKTAIERLELSSICLNEDGTYIGISRNIVKTTERVATGGRKAPKGAMKKRGDKVPFCPGGSEPRVCESGQEKCAPIKELHKKVVFHAERLKRK